MADDCSNVSSAFGTPWRESLLECCQEVRNGTFSETGTENKRTARSGKGQSTMRFQATTRARPLLPPRPHLKLRATTDVPTALSTTPASTSATTSTSAPRAPMTATRSTRRAGTRSATTFARIFRASCSTVTTRSVIASVRSVV